MKSMKKILATILVCIMMCSALTVNVMAANNYVKPFKDVSATSWYKNLVSYVYNTGLMSGISDDMFGPEDTLTRAMFVTILGRMHGVDKSQYTGSNFQDVPTGQWYSPYVKWASEKGIVSGYGSSIFGTNDPITREAMAAMISRYLKVTGISLPDAENAVSHFKDAASVSEWARESLELMRRTGLIVGDADQCFNPQNTASRAEAASVFMSLRESAIGPAFLESCQIQKYKGKIYTVLDMNSDSGMTKIPGYHDYMSSMIIYNDYIYYTEPSGTGQDLIPLYRMRLDGSDRTLLIQGVDNWSGFCIYKDKLYYRDFDWDTYESSGKVYDLKTGRTNVTNYLFETGNNDVWISTSSDVNETTYEYYWYCSYPGFNNIKDLSLDKWYYGYGDDRGLIDIYKDYVYYVMNNKVMRFSVHSSDVHEKVIDFKSGKDCFIVGSGLYYYNDDSCSTLKRFDLKTKTYKLYDITSLPYPDMIAGIEELDGKLYFDSYNGNVRYNTSAWELNLSNGSLRTIGTWFES